MGEIVKFPVPYKMDMDAFNDRLKALGEIEKELERLVEIYGWDEVLVQFRGLEVMKEFNGS